jgi:hypothetical protein
VESSRASPPHRPREDGLARPADTAAAAGGEQQWRAAERRHPTGRERMGSPALQTRQYPILLTPWVCFRAAFQTFFNADRCMYVVPREFDPNFQRDHMYAACLCPPTLISSCTEARPCFGIPSAVARRSTHSHRSDERRRGCAHAQARAQASDHTRRRQEPHLPSLRSLWCSAPARARWFHQRMAQCAALTPLLPPHGSAVLWMPPAATTQLHSRAPSHEAHPTSPPAVHTGNLIHWGSNCNRNGASDPRASLAFVFRRADSTPGTCVCLPSSPGLPLHLPVELRGAPRVSHSHPESRCSQRSP